ncbi:MAG TPA: hypothetical protein VFQ54_09505 [Thermomicrobiales bacterium]|nr:hypothetical protein [Thermomicrobiales bacterium]
MNVQPIEQARTPRRAAVREPFVLPPARALLAEAVPSLVMAAAALGAALLGALEILNIPLWAFGMIVPPLLVFALADGVTQPLWKRASVIDLVVLLAIFPLLVVRQSVARIPFMDTSNGTMMAPVLMTLILLIGLTGVAVGSAALCREDPEYSGVVFLPAAMFVPIFAGATSITSFRTAMLMTATIYLATAILTMVASVAPRQWVIVFTPATLALEFLILTAVRGSDIFPIGAGFASKALFFFVVAYTVALAIAVPMLSYWVRHVSLIVHGAIAQEPPPSRRAAASL